MPSETPLPIQEWPDTFQNVSFSIAGSGDTDYTILFAERDMVIDRVDFFATAGTTLAMGQTSKDPPFPLDTNETNIIGDVNSSPSVGPGIDLSLVNNVVVEGNTLIATIGASGAYTGTIAMKIRSVRK